MPSVIGDIAKFLWSIGVEGLKRESTRILKDVRLQGPPFIYIICILNNVKAVRSGVTGALVSQCCKCILG